MHYIIQTIYSIAFDKFVFAKKTNDPDLLQMKQSVGDENRVLNDYIQVSKEKVLITT